MVDEDWKGYHRVFPCQRPMYMAEMVQMGLHVNNQANPKRVINRYLWRASRNKRPCRHHFCTFAEVGYFQTVVRPKNGFRSSISGGSCAGGTGSSHPWIAVLAVKWCTSRVSWAPTANPLTLEIKPTLDHERRILVPVRLCCTPSLPLFRSRCAEDCALLILLGCI
jgi:hypothetical protein